MAVTHSRHTLLKKLAWFLPVVLFLLLALAALQRGALSPWHEKCVEFCRQSAWHEMAALAENMDRIGRPDAETLLWGMIASNQLEDKSGTELFGQRLLQQRALNWRMESEAVSLYYPARWLDRILMHRTRLVYSVLLLSALLQALSLLTRRDLLPWLSALALLGCLALLV